MRGRVLALALLNRRDLTGGQLQTGLERIQQGGLPDAGRAGHDREVAGQASPQLLDADAGLRRREQDVVADALVGPEGRAGRIRVEVHLVRDEQRRDLVVLGHDQEPIDQPGVRRRPIGREHDGHQVGVGDDHVLPPRAPWAGLATAESPDAGLDRGDGAGAVGQPLDDDPVADHREVGALALLLHPAPQPRLDQLPVVGGDRVEAGARSQDETLGHAHPSAPNAIP